MLDKDSPLPQSTFRRYLDPLAATVTEFHALNRALSANSAVLDTVVDNARRAGVPLPTLAGILKPYGQEYIVRFQTPVATVAQPLRPLAPSRLLSHMAAVIKVLDEQVKIMSRMDYSAHLAHAMVNNAQRAGIADYLLCDILEDLDSYSGPNPEWGDLSPGNFPVLAAEHAKRVAFRSKQIRSA